MTPELFVQHAINCVFSRAVGMSSDLIALSTVPPTAPPAPKLRLDLTYAVALREVFHRSGIQAEPGRLYPEHPDIDTDPRLAEAGPDSGLLEVQVPPGWGADNRAFR